MTTVGAFDAKTHLSRLLKRVAEGETIQITRRGIPVAKLVPVEVEERADPADVVRDIRSLRKGLKLGNLKIRKLIDEGRRY